MPGAAPGPVLSVQGSLFTVPRSELGVAAVFSVALAVLLTWPQALSLGTAVSAHGDPFFSIWRIAWIAHSLVSDPSHLFDANIFHPETGTLAYSDATLLQGVLAAPVLWARLPPVLVYNLLLLAGIAGSGAAMFVLARSVTGSLLPSLVASAIFELAPYRIEHFMHLELQWTMWMPLTFWAILLTVDAPSWKRGALAGLFLWLQILSCVYYGVFLGLAAGACVAALALVRPWATLRALPWLALGAALAVALSLPYALQYLGVSDTVGSRPLEAIRQYSATPASYLASPPENWLWGWTADRWGAPELRLFPGTLACLLAVAGLFARPRFLVLAFAAVTAVAVVLSLGLNTPVYAWIVDRFDALQGLRAPARFAILAVASMAVLSALGVQVVLSGLARPDSMKLSRDGLFATVVLALLLVEYQNTGMVLTRVAPAPGAPLNVYVAAQAMGSGAMLELPLPALDALPGREPVYSYWSVGTWHRRINGYSGYYPPSFVQTVERLESFPDTASLAHLRTLGVRFVVVHRTDLKPDAYGSLLLRMTNHPGITPRGLFRDPEGDAALFVLEP